MTLELDGHSLTLGVLANETPSAVLASGARATMQKSAAIVGEVLSRGKAVYGLNTGFGA
ncbi:MAG: aromatic amino acid lyase, partial [Gammaproteobacteria bacterium]